jgi:hypothetical protein
MEDQYAIRNEMKHVHEWPPATVSSLKCLIFSRLKDTPVCTCFSLPKSATNKVHVRLPLVYISPRSTALMLLFVTKAKKLLSG